MHSAKLCADNAQHRVEQQLCSRFKYSGWNRICLNETWGQTLRCVIIFAQRSVEKVSNKDAQDLKKGKKYAEQLPQVSRCLHDLFPPLSHTLAPSGVSLKQQQSAVERFSFVLCSCPMNSCPHRQGYIHSPVTLAKLSRSGPASNKYDSHQAVQRTDVFFSRCLHCCF